MARQGVHAAVTAIILIPDRVQGESVVVVGTFDGVHRGHQSLFGRAMDIAKAQSLRTIAVTFDPPPRMILRPNPSYRLLTTLPERIRLLRLIGVNDVVVCPFNHDVAERSAGEFCQILVDALGMKYLVGGPDLALGHRRLGTPDVLRDLGDQLGFRVELGASYEQNGRAIRSHEIRQLVRDGCVAEAAALLGHPVSMSGIVVHGDARGRTIGFATANLSIDERHLLPGDGVYAVRAGVGDERLSGVMNIGVRPTVNGTRRTIEIHLLDVSLDLYDQTLQVDLVARIRDEQRFTSLEGLVDQIRRDVDHARRILIGG